MHNRLLQLSLLGATVVTAIIPHSVSAFPSDVSRDTWYGDTIESFVSSGYISETQPFRPTHNATRGEFVDLIVKMLGGAVHAPFSTQSFDDVPTSKAYFNVFEEAGLMGWLKGTDSCYGTHPCTANPNGLINRAEASALIIRAFGLSEGKNTPSFNDNPSSKWFAIPINSAASLCILQGDAGGKRVRPADNLIRAEMVTMLKRVIQKLQYPNCTSPANFALPSLTNEQPKSTDSIPFMKSSSASLFPTSSSSSVSSSQPTVIGKMKINIEFWKGWHVDMINKAKDLAKQLNATSCINQLADLENELLQDLNEYTKIFNDPATPSILNNTENDYHSTAARNILNRRIVEIESSASNLKWQIDLVPSVCNSPTATPTPTQQIYVVPVYPSSTQPTETHDEMCNRMTAEIALKGGFGSGAASQQLYSAGCVSLQQFCNGFAISGIPQYLWPAECK